MLATLLESRPARERSRSAAFTSLVAHTAAITLALYATAIATPIVSAPPRTDPIIYVEPAARPTPATQASEPDRAPVVRTPDVPAPTIRVPTIVPTGLPDVPLSSIGVETVPTFGHASPTTLTSGPTSPVGPATGSPYSELTVDRPARLVRNTSRPSYPDLLRRDRIEGAVLATYVVDTLGRVESGSFRVLDSAHPLFERSVRDALAKMRFVPAEAGGRRVRQVVEQSFLFTLRR